MAHMTNTNEEDFGDVADAAVTVTHAVLGWDLKNAAQRKVIWNGALANARTLAIGDPIELPAGSLDINYPPGNDGVDDGFTKDMMDAIFTDEGNDAQMALGTAAITFTGNTINNEVTDSGYAVQQVEITRGTGNAP